MTKSICNILIVLLLSVLVAWTGEAACKSCRRTNSSSNARTIRVSCKVGENATPAKRIGIKQSFEGEVCKVSDGDTIWVKVEGRDRAMGDKNGKVKIRMDRIDAPESDQAYGKAANEALSKKVAGKRVRVEWKKRDQYGRVLGVVYVGDEDVNLWMVKEGNAWHYDHFDKTAAYTEAQKAAKAKRLGLWHDDGAINPYEWRKAKRGKYADHSNFTLRKL